MNAGMIKQKEYLLNVIAFFVLVSGIFTIAMSCIGGVPFGKWFFIDYFFILLFSLIASVGGYVIVLIKRENASLYNKRYCILMFFAILASLFVLIFGFVDDSEHVSWWICLVPVFAILVLQDKRKLVLLSDKAIYMLEDVIPFNEITGYSFISSDAVSIFTKEKDINIDNPQLVRDVLSVLTKYNVPEVVPHEIKT